MNWTDLIDTVAERAGLSRAQSRAALTALVAVIQESLVNEDTVQLRGLGSFSGKWTEGRVLRSIQSRRKMWVGGKLSARFRPAKGLRDALDTRADKRWKDPEHQKAWRLAETLVGDLALYNTDVVPEGLDRNLDVESIAASCAAAFGDAWDQAVLTFDERVSAEVREDTDYLCAAVLRRWTS